MTTIKPSEDITIKKERKYKPIRCTRCGETTESNSSRQKYCKSCAILIDGERSLRYYHNHRDMVRIYKHEHRQENIEQYLAKEYYYRQKNLEKRREYSRNYRKEHLDYFDSYNKEWRDNNREQIAAYSRQYRQDNAEHVHVGLQKYRQEHPDKYRVYNHNRHARIHGNGGSHTVEEEYELFEWQEGRCHYCGDFLYLNLPYHIDHKIPTSRGGSNDITNIAITCPDCNLSKHNKTEEEFFNGNYKTN